MVTTYPSIVITKVKHAVTDPPELKLGFRETTSKDIELKTISMGIVRSTKFADITSIQ